MNVRSNVIDFQLSDFKKIKFDKTIVQQVQTLLKPKRKNKEIEIDFDGMLKIIVYNEKMMDQYNWNEDYLKSGTWSISIGVTRQGVVRHDFDEHKHLIVAGATGYGKSAIQKLIVASLVLQMPDDVKLHLIDLKGGSAFQRFKGLKQTIHFTRDPQGEPGITSSIVASTLLVNLSLSKQREIFQVVYALFWMMLQPPILL